MQNYKYLSDKILDYVRSIFNLDYGKVEKVHSIASFIYTAALKGFPNAILSCFT